MGGLRGLRWANGPEKGKGGQGGLVPSVHPAPSLTHMKRARDVVAVKMALAIAAQSNV